MHYFMSSLFSFFSYSNFLFKTQQPVTRSLIITRIDEDNKFITYYNRSGMCFLNESLKKDFSELR